MGRILFHSIDNTVQVSGRERAAMSVLTGDTTVAVLSTHLGRGDDGREILRSIVRGHSTTSSDFAESLQLAIRVASHGEFFVIDGEKLDMFQLTLNTLCRLGGDPAKLFARLHGQCEIHCWVDGPNRKWLSSIIREGRESRMYRKDMGWEGVCDLLESSDSGEVVCSYTVCESFPSPFAANWEDDCDGEEFYDLPRERQWELSMRSIRESHRMLELTPDNWRDYFFGHGRSAFDISAHVDDLIEAGHRTDASVSATPNS